MSQCKICACELEEDELICETCEEEYLNEGDDE